MILFRVILFFGLYLISTLASSDDNVLVIGYENRPPFHYVDNNNELTGLDIDLVNAIFGLADVEFRFVQYPWKRVIFLLEQGEIDVAMDSSLNEEREQFALFPKESYRYGYNALFVRAKDRERFSGVKSLSDLLDKKVIVAVKLGSSYSFEYDRLLFNRNFTSKLVFRDVDRSTFELLANGRVDATIADEFAGSYAIAALNQTGNIIKHMYLYGKEEAESHLMFSKKSVSEDTVDKISEAIISFKATDDYQGLINKHLDAN